MRPSLAFLVLYYIFTAFFAVAPPPRPLFGSKLDPGRREPLSEAQIAAEEDWWQPITNRLPNPGASVDWMSNFKNGYEPTDNGQSHFELITAANAKEEVKEYYQRSGWDMDIQSSEPSVKEFGPMLRDMNWDELDKWQYVGSVHRYPYKDSDGQVQEPSYGSVRGWLNKELGILWVDEAMAPKYFNPDLDSYPELQSTSDVLVTQWVYLDPTTIEANGNLEHVVMQHIAPLVDTLNFIKRALGYDPQADWTNVASELKSFPADEDPAFFHGKIDGQTFYYDPSKPVDPNTDFLQTVHGKALGYLLWQHQPILGKKYVDYWTIFSSTSDDNQPHPTRISVYVHLKDLPADPVNQQQTKSGGKSGGSVLQNIEANFVIKSPLLT